MSEDDSMYLDEVLTAFVTVIDRPEVPDDAVVLISITHQGYEEQLLAHCKANWERATDAPRLKKVDELDIVQTYFKHADEYIIFDGEVEVKD